MHHPQKTLKNPIIASLGLLGIVIFSSSVFAFTNAEIAALRAEIKSASLGERIAFWAEKFIGTPYDPDPLGEYVSRKVIVADERVDCMYLTFRAVELAFGNTPEEAEMTALERRFRNKGVMREGKVINYEDRFRYGEDMVGSGKWGREITAEIGRPSRIRGPRGAQYMIFLTPGEMLKNITKLRSGDLIFFVKSPDTRKEDEIVGHIGTIKKDKTTKVSRRKNNVTYGPAGPDQVYLIHASGKKGSGGIVKKVLLKDYILRMPFVGAKITRFDQS